jgi:hypothetical protein
MRTIEETLNSPDAVRRRSYERSDELKELDAESWRLQGERDKTETDIAATKAAIASVGAKTTLEKCERLLLRQQGLALYRVAVGRGFEATLQASQDMEARERKAHSQPYEREQERLRLRAEAMEQARRLSKEMHEFSSGSRNHHLMPEWEYTAILKGEYSNCEHGRNPAAEIKKRAERRVGELKEQIKKLMDAHAFTEDDLKPPPPEQRESQ